MSALKNFSRKLFKFLAGSRWKRLLLLFLAGPVFLFFLLNLLFPLQVRIDYSTTITARDGTVLQGFLTKDQKWRMKAEANEISPQLKKAIIYKEDKYFYYHFGLNPIAIVRAMFNNVVHARRTSGASTITMQVARLIYPKERTYLNKLVELFHALQLELNYSKEEILQFYFNLVPYGGNIEGVKSAALLYYGRLPDKLSLGQITTLAIVPNRPGSLRLGKNSPGLLQARNKWLQRMKSDHLFPEKELDNALAEPLDASRVGTPVLAPHLALRLRKGYPGVPVVHSTLDPFKQQKITAIAYNYSRHLQGSGIYNAAVIVVNNRTRCVEAYLGSPDFSDADHAGQVDGVSAIRSPGSTLKPLVYGLAFDRGLLTPKSVIADVPVNFGGYAPENFNSHFNGNVTVESALMNSLNIPAVRTLQRLGLQTLIDKMKDAGFEQAKYGQSKLGLSMVLGGCGVRLEELAGLFCAFGNEGRYAPLKYIREDSTTVTTPILSPAAAYMISEILSQPNRPEMPSFLQGNAVHIPRIAWKTGTSYGRRDAWSIGYNRNYTIGVWVGNFSGEGVPELTGADKATPLLFELFNSLDYNARGEWFLQPAGLDFRIVCTESGKVPDEFCDHTVIDYCIPRVSAPEKCEHLRAVDVSADGSISYCKECRPPAGYKTLLYPNLDPDLASFYSSEHISYRKIPDHNPSCNRIFSGQAPLINSLVNQKEYLIERDAGQEMQLSCSASNDVSLVYWYINDRFYKSCKAEEKIFFSPGEGNLKISCSDDKGRNSDIRISVKYY